MKATPARDKKSILIVGGGPGGSALGTFLAREGFKVTLFHNDSRPELIVGESLIPATIPVLRALGVEEEVKAIGIYKPGATFYVRPEMPLEINFADGNGDRPSYAYNVPRTSFDEILLRAAEGSGVTVIRKKLSLEASAGLNPRESRVLLDESAQHCLRELDISQPELFVDATGRAREFSRLFGIPSKKGSRNDVVRFAHLDHCEIEHPGHIHVNRLSRGWSWRIPLPGKISVGIVMDGDSWKTFGAKPEEQYDRFLAEEPALAGFTRGSKRLTGIASYTNYQMISEQFFGANWVLLGDAGGFVDPIFSSGLDLTLNGAQRCARAILRGTHSAFAKYEQAQRVHISAWQLLAESFYNGNLFGLIRASSLSRDRLLWKHLVPILERNTAQTIAGTVKFDSLRFRACKFFLEKGYGAKFGSRLAIR